MYCTLPFESLRLLGPAETKFFSLDYYDNTNIIQLLYCCCCSLHPNDVALNTEPEYKEYVFELDSTHLDCISKGSVVSTTTHKCYTYTHFQYQSNISYT